MQQWHVNFVWLFKAPVTNPRVKFFGQPSTGSDKLSKGIDV